MYNITTVEYSTELNKTEPVSYTVFDILILTYTSPIPCLY